MRTVITACLLASARVAGAEVWPQEIIERPLTLDAGMFEAHLELSFDAVRFVNVSNGSSSTSVTEGLVLGGTAALGSRVEVGLDYGLSLNGFDIDGPLSVHLAYRAYRGAALDVATVVGLTYDFAASSSDLYVGVNARYRITPELAIGTSTSNLLAPGVPGFGPVVGQLQLGLDRDDGGSGASEPKPVTLDLPVYIAWQASPKWNAFAATNLGQIDIAHAENAFVFSKFVLVTAGAFFSPDHRTDLGVALWDDLEHPRSQYSLALMARIYKL